MMGKIFNKKNAVIFIFISLVGSVVFTSIKIALAPTVVTSDDLLVRVKSDYVLMLLQCIIGVIAMIVPSFVTKKIKIDIPSNMSDISL